MSFASGLKTFLVAAELSGRADGARTGERPGARAFFQLLWNEGRRPSGFFINEKPPCTYAHTACGLVKSPNACPASR